MHKCSTEKCLSKSYQIPYKVLNKFISEVFKRYFKYFFALLNSIFINTFFEIS